MIGGGHAHVAVLADWIRHGAPSGRLTLLTPEPYLRYSGMVPGWISGEHRHDAGLVDLAALAKAAGAELVLDRCVAIDPEARTVLTMANGLLPFERASIDVGGVGQAANVLSDDPRLLDVRPIGAFVEQLADRLDSRTSKPMQIAVIGGGAAGVELAFAVRNAVLAATPPKVTLITGRDGLLAEFKERTRKLTARELDRQSIGMLTEDAVFREGRLVLGEQDREQEADLAIAAIGSAAPNWPGAGAMQTDTAGYIAVDQFQRSISHPYIFAAGDCARRMDIPVPHSGVHAVHVGPVLAANLRNVLAGDEPKRTYRPRRHSLYLMSTGRGQAIASYGPLAGQGRWAARLKAWIDKRWIASYAVPRG